ncbi:hypothetical protein BGZ70_007392 [Mortierella alpina]|uniref:Cytochrome P450 n=1 Tax=Mortierella alpina TaxID=64518 RepID=A0A9P6M2T4_MORAP|nr:hypothetical protein BGZ70_007392 [Mortierella alpina]
MLGLVSTSSGTDALNVVKVALPLGIGLASAAFLSLKMTGMIGNGLDQSIPTAALRPGDKSHDAEYTEDPDLFLSTCEECYGPVFNLYLYNQFITMVSGPLAREVFMTENMNFGDAADDTSGIHSFTASITKSKRAFNDPAIHEMIRDIITPNLALFTPRIVQGMLTMVDKEFDIDDRKLIADPLFIFQEMIASAMANVFMGSEIAKNRNVLDSFIHCMSSFTDFLAKGPQKSVWRTLRARTTYGLLSPLQQHVQVLVDAATPVVQERRRQEAEALEKGLEYDRPLDTLQGLLDNFDKYGLKDLEDVCGHILVMVLVSVHTTSDSSTYLSYYLAAYPEYIEPLFQEQLTVLNQISQEREEQRQEKLKSGEIASVKDFEGTALDPQHDRDLTSAALKRMVRMDSFLREFFRFRAQKVSLAHMARKDVLLSNGITIRKGRKVMINVQSVHQSYDMQGEDPTEFRPWRFIGKSKAATKASTDFLPFGMGKHACPGRFLAVQELKTVGVLLVSRFSNIEIQDLSKKSEALLSRVGAPVPTGLYFTSRQPKAAN